MLKSHSKSSLLLSRPNTWNLLKSYWHSPEKVSAYFFLLALIIMTLLIVAINVAITYWYKAFWDALQNYNAHLVFELIGVFIGLATVYIVIAVYQYYVQSIFGLRWRRWLTKALIAHWLHNKSYYYIERFDQYTDNPDQRIQEDVDLFVQNSLVLFLGVVNAVTTLCSFVVVLWSLSDPVAIPVGGGVYFHLPGYLVWIALVYSVLGTYITHKIGRPLVQLNFDKQRREADFRFSAVRLRSNAENIALYHAEPSERQSIFEVFHRVIEITRQVIDRQKRLLYFTAGFNQVSVIIPLLAALPMYLAKKIKIGGIMQITNSFGQVQDSMSFIVSAYTSIAAWRSVVIRLTSFLAKISAAEAAYAAQVDFKIEPHADSTLEASQLQIMTQNGDVLFKDYTICFEQGKRYLIRGSSGIGKSTFVKVLAGIWPFAAGTVKIPANQKIMYLPQRSYLPLGSLRDTLLFPQEVTVNDDELKALLLLVNLPQLVDKLDVTMNWSDTLSLGEQQKIAFIRLLINRPDWILLDESTSSLDAESEAQMYRLLQTRLPHSTIISLAHRESLRQWHDEEICFTKPSCAGS